MGRADPARSYGWHLTQMFEAMERGELRTLYVIGENPAQSEADIYARATAARRARPAGRAGHRHDEHRGDGRRRASRDRVVVRGGGHRHEQRAARAARAQGARPARARRATTPGSSRELARRLGRDWGDPTAEEVWDELRSLSPMHAGMRYDRLEELGRHPVAVPRRGAPRLAVPARAALGGARRGPACAVQRRRGAAAVRGARRRVPDPPDDRTPAGVVQHRRAVGALPLAAAPRRVARPLARGRRAAGCSRTARSCASRPAAGRWRRRCGSTRRSARASRS